MPERPTPPIGFAAPLLLAAAGTLLGTDAATAQPNLYFDTEIVSMNLTGTALLPLGPNGALINVQINGTRAQDYNSSRSNNSGLIGDPPPPFPPVPTPIDPLSLDGQSFQLFSTYDLEFMLEFVDIDPNVDFNPIFGSGPITYETESSARLESEPGSVFVFDRRAPDFGMLRAGGPPKKQTHRGHVTVLKLAGSAPGPGGGAGKVALPPLNLSPGGIVLEGIPGSDEYSVTRGGGVDHSWGGIATFNGTIDSPIGQVPFFQDVSLGGTIIERGNLLNQIIPAPTAALSGILGVGTLMMRRRR